MKMSLISSAELTADDLRMVKVSGECKVHGPWERETLEAAASRMAGRCPHCEAPMQPIRFDMVNASGTCATHGAWTNSVPKAFAARMAERCPQCDQEAEEARLAREADEAHRSVTGARVRRMAKLLDSSGIPVRFQGRTFDNYETAEAIPEQAKALAKAKNYATNFDRVVELGAGLIFSGKPGTGKTHLACAVANHVMATYGKRALFLTVFDVFQRIKDTYGGGSASEMQIMAAICAPDLLILDEVGVQMGTKFEEVILTEIINKRYAAMAPTIILTNLDAKELRDYLGERIVDRFTEGGGALVPFNWESYRKNVSRNRNLPGNTFEREAWMTD
jgi:DNA replication protein DnaC